MTYSVTLTGVYRPGLEPRAVDEALARLFKQDVARMRDLVKRAATIKRGIDLPTAERFRQAIEHAGALCSIDDDSIVMSIDVPDEPRNKPVVTADRTQPDADETESVLLECGPSPKSYVAAMVVGVLLLPAFGLGLLVFLIIWIALKSTHYKLTNQRLFVRKGLLSRQLEEVQLYRVKDVSYRQGILERLLGVGSVVVISADASTPNLLIRGIESPEHAKETIRNAYRAARRREGVRTGERILD